MFFSYPGGQTCGKLLHSLRELLNFAFQISTTPTSLISRCNNLESVHLNTLRTNIHLESLNSTIREIFIFITINTLNFSLFRFFVSFCFPYHRVLLIMSIVLLLRTMTGTQQLRLYE